MAPLVSLPEEIIVEIMTNLDCLSLIHCALACRLLYDTYKNSPQLEYMLELSVNEMEDSGSDIPLPERLSRIRDLRINWANLNWEGWKELPLGMNDYRSHEFVAGVCAILAGESLEVMWLPSFRDAGRTVKHQLSEITPSGDFSIDPTQDLLVFLEIDLANPSLLTGTPRGQVHLRKLSTNENHPHAQQAALTFWLSPDPNGAVLVREGFLYISHDILALFIDHWHGQRRLLIWDWHNDNLIYDSGANFGPDIRDFALLDHSSFVLTSSLNSGSLLLYTFSPTSSFTEAPILTASLHLPLITSFKYVGMLCVDSCPLQAKPAEDALSFTLSDSRIFAFTITYADFDVPHDSGHSYEIFVHNRTLLEYVQGRSTESFENGTKAASPLLDVHWDHWGKSNTRLLPCPEPMPWSRYMHGYRVVRMKPHSFLSFIEVLDFNMARVSLSSVASGSEHRLCTEPSEISQDIFVSPVITGLPYQSSTREIATFYHSCMIDEQRVVVVDTDTHIHHFVKGLEVYWF